MGYHTRRTAHSLEARGLLDLTPCRFSTLNGDAILDLATVGLEVAVFLGNGDGTFQPRRPFSVGTDPLSLVAADLNADGRIDLAAANYTSNDVSLLVGNGDGTFASKGRFNAGRTPFDLAAADWNGDGVLDLAAADFEPSQVSVLLGSGNGAFNLEGHTAAGRNPRSLIAGDWNGDGRMDLTTANSTSNDVSLMLGNGDGTFRAQRRFTVPRGTLDAALGDMDGDGRIDLVVTSGIPFSQVTILLNEFTFDRTPPALTCPEGLSALCSVREGAIVDFSAAAVDDCDPSPAVACDPPPDGTFPVGMTVVTCTATDAAGNRSECRFEVQVICGGELPGNCNQDGALDISDAICLLGFLFLGKPAALPCSGGTRDEQENRDLLDWNGDGVLDSSDAVSQFHWLFQDGPAHFLGQKCRFLPGCPQDCRLAVD